MRTLLAGLAVVVLASACYAGDYTIGVCAVQVSERGRVLIEPCGGWTSVNGCKDDWIQWSVDSRSGQAMYDAALLALSRGLSVRVRIVESEFCHDYDVTKMIRVSKE